MNKVDVIKSKRDIQRIKDVLIKGYYRNYLMFIVGINTGLRISQILSLKISDLFDKEKLVTTIYFNDIEYCINGCVQECLSSYIENSEEVFSSNTYIFKSTKGDNPIERSQAYRILNDASKKAGINIKFGTHTLRKTFGYHFYLENKNLKYLQRLFNHSTVNVTADYIGIDKIKNDCNYSSFKL